jgi:hypothetical protein
MKAAKINHLYVVKIIVKHKHAKNQEHRYPKGKVNSDHITLAPRAAGV